MSLPEPAIVVVLNHEIDPERGPYSYDPKDAGGPTNYGITQGYLSGMLGRPATVVEVQQITLEAAIGYYRKMWGEFPYGLIHSQTLATKVFDFRVNAGPREAFMCLQRACGDIGNLVDVDGMLGIHTIASCNASVSMRLAMALTARLKDFYNSIAAHDPTQVRFLSGWLQRASWGT